MTETGITKKGALRGRRQQAVRLKVKEGSVFVALKMHDTSLSTLTPRTNFWLHDVANSTYRSKHSLVNWEKWRVRRRARRPRMAARLARLRLPATGRRQQGRSRRMSPRRRRSSSVATSECILPGTSQLAFAYHVLIMSRTDIGGIFLPSMVPGCSYHPKSSKASRIQITSPRAPTQSTPPSSTTWSRSAKLLMKRQTSQCARLRGSPRQR